MIHRARFALWRFARKHRVSGTLIKWFGKYSTRNFERNHAQRMVGMGRKLFPRSRYMRKMAESVQCILLLGSQSSAEDADSIDMFLNHLGIPYWKAPNYMSLSSLEKGQHLLIATGCNYDELAACQEYAIQNRGVVFALPGLVGYRGGSDCLYTFDFSAEEFLPYREGLRSERASQVISALIKQEQVLIMSCFLPPLVGLRVDDVRGINTRGWLDIILGFGWRPNLGIFINDVEENASTSIPNLTDRAYEKLIDVSPHALSADRFLFFDYPRGRAFTKVEFSALWKKVIVLYAKWDLSMSSVLNAHFHVISSSSYELLHKAGVRYNFSELAPDFSIIIPSADYLPSGDPICCTGTCRGEGPMQIFSGNSAQDCNQPSSLYDFMMHAPSTNKVIGIARRLVKRLSLSLRTGFAAFATTHEYLLESLSKDEQSQLWAKVDELLLEVCPKSTKVSMADIGRMCENHTHVQIERVTCTARGWYVHLSGQCRGVYSLSVLGKGKITSVDIQPFQGKHEVEVRNEQVDR